MANITKARETLAVIRANPHRLNMKHYAHGPVNPHATNWTECHTTFCFAGWQAVLDGLTPEYDDYSQATKFYFCDVVSGQRITADTHARKSLELTSEEAEAIFERTQITDIDDLEWIVETVLTGQWEYCEECAGDGCGECADRGIVRHEPDQDQETKPTTMIGDPR